MQTYNRPVKDVETTELVSIDLLKAHCSVDHDEDNKLLFLYSRTAQNHISSLIDRPLRRLLVNTTVVGSPCGKNIILDYSPVHKINSITVRKKGELDSVLLVKDVDYAYWKRGYMNQAEIQFSKDNLYYSDNIYNIEYVAGLIGSGVDVSALVAATLLIVGQSYEIREAIVPHTVNKNPAFNSLISPYKRL